MKFFRCGFLTVLSGIFSIPFGILMLVQVLRLPVVSVVALLAEPKVVRLGFFMVILTVITLLLALCKKTPVRFVNLGFAALGLICALIVMITNLSIASKNGAEISLGLALSGAKDSAAADVEIDAYTVFDGEEVGLSIWLPRNVDSGAPVAMFIHGGGWMNESRFTSGDMHHCRFFAENGYLVVSVDYPLASEGNPMYDCQEDTIALAIAWLQENAAEYGGDMSRFYVMGNSAGGNLALNLAARINQGEFTELLGEDFCVNAASVMFPATDISAMYEKVPAPLGFLVRSMCTTNWGGTPEEYPERYAANSTNLLVDESMAPVFTVYGKNDHMTSSDVVESFIQTLTDLNVDNDSISFPFADHLCDVAGSIEAQTWRDGTLKWFAVY